MVMMFKANRSPRRKSQVFLRRASLDVIASIMFLKFQPELGNSVVR